MTAATLILRDPLFRAIAAMAALYGVVNACIYPYLSLIAVERVGISDGTLAFVLAIASAAAVLASVLFGILADQIGNRRLIALMTVSATVLGTLLMVIAPLPGVMLLAHGLLIPMGTAIFGQIFALNNLATQNHPAQRDALQATVRAVVSAAFLLTLLFWTWGLGQGANRGGFDVMAVYASATGAAVLLVAIIWRGWPRLGREPWTDRPLGLNLRAALIELSRPAIAFRLFAMGAIGGLPMLYIILTPLIFSATPERSLSDVALMVGLVAGFEVPFMLALPRLQKRLSRQSLILGGALIYGGFVTLLALYPDGSWLWLLPVLAGLGAAPILTLPIGYWQDLMQGRPGTAAALMALQRLAGDLLSAASFALGTALGGYTTAALLGGGLAMLGAVALWLADRKAKPAG
jgi:MFS transporter, SET family, sugar efflux transporter